MAITNPTFIPPLTYMVDDLSVIVENLQSFKLEVSDVEIWLRLEKNC